ncbi:MAG TPA: HD domain-containing protein [Candidatus Limnocylindria bacterium]|nr:HD domain-containing protein [Candidatus Limnocylindria bacterium]
MTGPPDPVLGDRFASAVATAAELHGEQARKGGRVPYLAHLLAVASLVLEDGGDEDEAIAALLHDAAEDAGGRETLEAIRGYFGERVALIVAGCSDAMPAPGEAKPPWETRKAAYLEELRGADPSVLRVSLADKLHNGRSLLADLRADGASVWERFNAPPDRQAWYYGELLATYESAATSSRHLPELRQVVSEIRAAAQR